MLSKKSVTEELARDKRDARDVPLCSDLVGTVLDSFLFAAATVCCRYTRAKLERGMGKLAFCASVLGKAATPRVPLSRPKPGRSLDRCRCRYRSRVSSLMIAMVAHRPSSPAKSPWNIGTTSSVTPTLGDAIPGTASFIMLIAFNSPEKACENKTPAIKLLTRPQTPEPITMSVEAAAHDRAKLLLTIK